MTDADAVDSRILLLLPDLIESEPEALAFLESSRQQAALNLAELGADLRDAETPDQALGLVAEFLRGAFMADTLNRPDSPTHLGAYTASVMEWATTYDGAGKSAAFAIPDDVSALTDE